MKKNKKCPRCKGVINSYPALSRWDNKTNVCDGCGAWEAICQLENGGRLPAIKDGLDLKRLVTPKRLR